MIATIARAKAPERPSRPVTTPTPQRLRILREIVRDARRGSRLYVIQFRVGGSGE